MMVEEGAEDEGEREEARFSIQYEAQQNQGIIQLQGTGMAQKIVTNPKNML